MEENIIFYKWIWKPSWPAWSSYLASQQTSSTTTTTSATTNKLKTLCPTNTSTFFNTVRAMPTAHPTSIARTLDSSTNTAETRIYPEVRGTLSTTENALAEKESTVSVLEINNCRNFPLFCQLERFRVSLNHRFWFFYQLSHIKAWLDQWLRFIIRACFGISIKN